VRRGSELAATDVLTPSSGNVFLDLGFPPAEAEYLLLRSRLMHLVGRLIADRGLTQQQAARVFRVSQPRVSDVVRGRVERFTIDALVEMLARAGVRLDVVVLPASA
jgi:predicted XRE-type DNA-binding protein